MVAAQKVQFVDYQDNFEQEINVADVIAKLLDYGIPKWFPNRQRVGLD